ncbi:SIS domain-containing protein [Bombilactobacillus thymidiniphilus]|uniref:Fructosamine deglycase n=1 Tax=Bombilactobacillus thymidiniphilus TaxID=2923363 RepID=A0ABY4PEX4_9LACO|nr:SIS domain-containing protein [Bombilactobacillus thymidiniphilus]UQS84190.1 SIS domain-containing protein [Bombilactobacillus thymidiniphilus]
MTTTPKSIIADIKRKQPKINRVIFTGCGASMSDLYPAYYFVAQESKHLLSAIKQANEFNYAAPKNIGADTIVITASLGGTTPESIAATKYARELGAHVITLSHDPNSPIVKEAEYSLIHGFEEDYAHKTEKMKMALELAVEIVNQFESYEFYDEAQNAFDGIFALINEEAAMSEPAAIEFADRYQNEDKIYVLGSGATTGVAYSTASFLFMEMQWISAPTINSGEFFHGPFELAVKDAPYLLFMNDGQTRHLDARALEFLQRFETKNTVIDAKDHNLASVASKNVIDYFNPILLTGVMRIYAVKLSEKRQHPLTKRRYMWKLENY